VADVLLAFSVIWAVTGVGWLVGRFHLLGPGAETVLARLVFFVATPALLVVTLSASPPAALLSPILATYVLSSVLLAGVGATLGRFVWRLNPGESVVAALCAGYVNAANLGIPVAAYVFGDFSVVAPVLLFQLLIASPLALGALESFRVSSPAGIAPDRRSGLAWRLVLLPVRNPIMLASAVGLALAVFAWRLPHPVSQPLELLGQAAVPTALLALGMSLSPKRSPSTEDSSDSAAVPGMVVTLVALKVVGQPVLAYLIGRYGFGLDGRVLLGCVIMAGLPAAQNVFVYASRYRQGVAIARNAVIVSTVVALPTLAAATHLLT
jgi:predicted permease